MRELPQNVSFTVSWSPPSSTPTAKPTPTANPSSQSVPCRQLKSKLGQRTKRANCPKAAGAVQQVEPTRNGGRDTSPTAEQKSASARPSPRTTNESMPKARNRNQTTTAAMHRKCKSKSKISPVSETKTCTPFPSGTSADAVLSTISTARATESAGEAAPAGGIRVKAIPHQQTGNTKRRCRSTRHTRNHTPLRSVRCRMPIPLPTLGATSFVTLLTLICIETVLLSTMSNCAKTFYMHWNTSNSIFRIDNTDHIIDVNKGNLAFEFDQVHIICPVYEPGTYENETEKYIIYNVSKVEYETCRITNADPRVIAICDKPQKLMFFTITFRPFTPQPGGLEFLPGNDYYFISTSSKDDLYRRIGGRCSTNNMKVVFKVCCAAEEKNKTTPATTSVAVAGTDGGNVVGNAANNDEHNPSHGLGQHHNHNTIGISGVNTGLITGVGGGAGTGGQLGTSINTNIDQFNRIPIQPNIIGNNIGANGVGLGPGSGVGGGGIILSPGHGHGSINMLPPGRGGVNMGYPGHHHIQTGIRINNVPTQQNKGNGNGNVNGNDDHHHYDKHPNEVVKNEELTYNRGSASAAGHGAAATATLGVLVLVALHQLAGHR